MSDFVQANGKILTFVMTAIDAYVLPKLIPTTVDIFLPVASGAEPLGADIFYEKKYSV